MHIFTDSLSSLMALSNVVTNHNWVEEVKLKWLKLRNKQSITVTFHWIPSHQNIEGNEDADKVAKEATKKESVDVVAKLSYNEVRRRMKRAVECDWQSHWEKTTKGRRTYRFFKKVTMGRCKSDFYLNQILTGHGVFPAHQARMFGKQETCPFDGEIGDMEHYIFRCTRFNETRTKFLPIGYSTLQLQDLMEMKKARQGLKIVVKTLMDLLIL